MEAPWISATWPRLRICPGPMTLAHFVIYFAREESFQTDLLKFSSAELDSQVVIETLQEICHDN